MSQEPKTLVCFAVKEEAGAFNEIVGSRPHVTTLLTGMGQANAEKTIRAALRIQKPHLVLSCGFAGGLRPELASGAVVFAADGQTELTSALLNAGARPAKFFCAQRVATTAEEKRALRENTEADAVEMESQIICSICREQKVPSAIVRVILDSANEDLPLNFNQLMTDDQRMDYVKLARALIKSPGKVGALLRLQKQSRAAAAKLAEVLAKITEAR